MASVGASEAELRDAAVAFGGQVPVVARLAEMVTGSLGPDTGDSGLNGLVESLCGGVASSLAGFGTTLAGDASGLLTVAGSFARVGDSAHWPAGDG